MDDPLSWKIPPHHPHFQNKSGKSETKIAEANSGFFFYQLLFVWFQLFPAEQPVWCSKGPSGLEGQRGGEDQKEVFPWSVEEDQLPHEEDKQGGAKQPSTSSCFSNSASGGASSTPWAGSSTNSTSFTCCHPHSCALRLSSPSEGSAPGGISPKVNWTMIISL